MLEVKNEPRSFTQAQDVRDDLGDGGTFISEGKTPEEKHHRLTAACSAWNMACGSPDVRRQQLEMFPDDKRQIASAKIVMVGKGYRIEVASATL